MFILDKKDYLNGQDKKINSNSKNFWIRLKQIKILFAQVTNFIRDTFNTKTTLYGLFKIHTDGNPIRPVVI